MKLLTFADKELWTKLAAFGKSMGSSEAIRSAVTSVLADVRERGDAAVLDYTAKFDKARLTAENLRLPANVLRSAVKTLPRKDVANMKEALACVRDFHKKTMPKSWTAKNPQGATVGERFYPIQRVGVYVPGGQVPLVSTVIMAAALAKLAGCPEVAVCTPPAPDGSINRGILAMLDLCGIDEVYRIGGSQAIAAMAYGTKTIKPVFKIFGPGNAYVTEAKRQVFGEVGIDLLPGPSEAMVIADRESSPAYAAADLLAQAEHGSGAEKIYLVANCKRFITAVNKEIERQVATLTHAGKIRRILEEGFVTVLVKDWKQAAAVANFVAPEHLELHVDRPAIKFLSGSITNAGAMLLGEDTPTVMGDFTAGPSHTLPTNRTGRFASGLQLSDFMRRTSIVSYDKRSLKKAVSVIETFSRMESLDAHGNSLKVRL